MHQEGRSRRRGEEENRNAYHHVPVPTARRGEILLRPHEGVFCRLSPSSIHGVGVFAVLPIPKGTVLFERADAAGLDVFVDDQEIQFLPPAIKKLYTDFCVLGEGHKWACPKTLDDISVGWYVNNNEVNPNISIIDWEYKALRDIAVGEEITVSYDSYSSMIQ